MIGVPGRTNQPISISFPGDNGTDWRVFEDNGQDEDYYTEYDPQAENIQFTPGKGYWAITNNDAFFNGTLDPVDMTQGDTFVIPLNPGWNLISNPFSMSIPISRLKQSNPNLLEVFYYYNSTSGVYETDFEDFEPFKGYYVFFPEPQNEEVRNELIIQNPNADHGDQDELEKPGVEREVLAQRLPGLTLHSSFPAVVADSKDVSLSARLVYPELAEPSELTTDVALDRGIIPHPPIDFSSYALMFNPEADQRGGYFQRTGSLRGGDEGYSLTIKGTVGETATLSLVTHELPSEMSALLVNPVTRKSWIITESEPVDIVLTEPKGTFRLYAGSTAELLERQQELLPTQIELMQNYPNPFNPVTNIRYAIPEEQVVRLEVFDMLGRRVQTLVDGVVPAGWHVSQFNAMNYASGVYVYRLVVGGTVNVQKMTVIK
jgi:hypothetical protein